MIASAWIRASAVLRWVRRHPRWATVLVVVAGTVMVDMVGTTMAIADNITLGGVAWLPPLDATDSEGVDLLHYAVLPLDRGDAWSIGKSFWTNPTDTIWTFYLMTLSWALWAFEFQLSFAWVDWISGPLSGIADLVQSVVSRIGWAPLALSITGLVCGAAILTGRIAKGAIELMISAMCLALSLGILLNPVGALTGPDGAIAWSAKQGGSFAVAITSDDTTSDVAEISIETAQTTLSDTITAPMIDLFVRRPAQEIAFGHQLAPDCSTLFSEQMQAARPLDTSSTAVRDAVHGCDQAAWDYVTNPGPGQMASALFIFGGVGAVMLLGVVFGMLLLLAVLAALWSAIKLIALLYVNMLPGVGRTALWKALVGMGISVLMVGFMIAVLAAYLKVVLTAMTAASDFGMPLIAQTGIINALIVALIVGLLVTWVSARRAGETLAARLARLGFAGGPSAPRRMSPVMASAQRLGEHYVHERFRKAPVLQDGNTTVNALMVGGVPRQQDGMDLGEVPAESSARGGVGRLVGAVGSASGAKRAIGAATTTAAAIGSGGTSSVVLAVAKHAGSTVLQRAIVAAAKPSAEGAEVQESPRFQAFGRQIVVDSAGQGTVRPMEAPVRDGIFTVTSMPRRPDAGSELLRERLAAAAARKALTA
ncbi:MAG: hypothetical protein QM598_05870 [Protaetiibacter sp.]